MVGKFNRRDMLFILLHPILLLFNKLFVFAFNILCLYLVKFSLIVFCRQLTQFNNLPVVDSSLKTDRPPP